MARFVTRFYLQDHEDGTVTVQHQRPAAWEADRWGLLHFYADDPVEAPGLRLSHAEVGAWLAGHVVALSPYAPHPLNYRPDDHVIEVDERGLPVAP